MLRIKRNKNNVLKIIIFLICNQTIDKLILNKLLFELIIKIVV